uniref:Fatty acid synthase pseudo-KR domain-containing protein n=1 Tax=Timema tahoe TaxID=61484 RepID=A0A7R9IHB7_9NEOP|nr:unnamed protein product [Timema tahoe]
MLKELPGFEHFMRTVPLDIANRMLSSTSSIGLLITPIDTLEKCVGLVDSASFILARSIGKQTPKISDGLLVVIEQQFDNEKLLLLRKAVSVEEKSPVIFLAGDEHSWPQQLKSELNISNGYNKRVYVVIKTKAPVDVKTLIQQLSKEPKADKLRYIFILDENAPTFSLSEDIYLQQLQQDLLCNVYSKGSWGSFLQLPFDEINEVPISLGLLPALRLESIQINCVGLNLRDPSVSESVQEKKIDDIGNLDLSGKLCDGTRIMCIVKNTRDMIENSLDSYLTWDVPESWNLEEAATVPWAYSLLSRKQKLTIPEPSRKQKLTIPEPSRKRKLNLPKLSRKQKLTITKPSRKQKLTIPEPSRKQKLTIPKPSRKQKITIPEPSRKQKLTIPKPLRNQKLTIPKPSRKKKLTIPGPSREKEPTVPRALQRARDYCPKAVKRARAYCPRAFKRARAYHPRTVKRAKAYHLRAFGRAGVYHIRAFQRKKAYCPRAFKRARTYSLRAFGRAEVYRPRAFQRAKANNSKAFKKEKTYHPRAFKRARAYRPQGLQASKNLPSQGLQESKSLQSKGQWPKSLDAAVSLALELEAIGQVKAAERVCRVSTDDE